MASGPLTVKIQINADGSAAIVGLNKVKGALDATGKEAKAASGGFKALSSSFQSLALTAGAALSVGALAASFTAANRQAGLLRASLETVTGSVAKATTAWEVLQGFAAQTPYSLEQAVQGFVKLKSMGLDPSMAALTSYGNTAGAMGKSLNQMIEAVADAATGEFERLKEFGINAKVEGDSVAMTFQGVTKTIGNNAQAIEQYLLDIGNVQFAGGMERQAKTLEGALSNLGDAWDQFWVKLGDTGLTQGVITVLNDVSRGIASLGEGMTGANGVASTFGSTMASLGEVVATTYTELKTGVWSDTTTAIMATAGAIGGAIGLMTALSAAVGIASGVWGAFTAVLLANPVTLAIAGIGALAGVLYTLQDQTIQVGDTTTTVGATVSAGWEITAAHSEAVWDGFSGYVTEQFNSLPPAVSSAGSAILSVWSAVMTNLQTIAAGAINYVANLFTWLGRSAGVLAGEVAMSFESGFSFDRLKEGLSGAVEYTDRLGEAGTRAAAGIAAASQEIAKKADNIRAVNQVERDYAKLERELADDNAKAAMAAKLHAFEQDNLGRHLKRGAAAAKDGAAATGAGGKAHGGAAKAVKDNATEIDALIKRVLPARDDTEQLAKATAILADKMAKGELSAVEYAAAIDKLEDELLRSTKAAQDLIDEYDREGAQARKLAEDSDRLQAIIAKGGEQAERAKVALENLGKQQAKNSQEADAWAEVWKNAVKRIDDTFANLWHDLFSGAKSTLDSLKRAISSWLAEVAHALITKPLVVAITAGMTGGSGTAGATGTVGASGTVANVASGGSSLGGLGNLFSMGSSLWSGVTGLFSGATLAGISAGWGTAMAEIGAMGFGGAFTTIMGQAGSLMASGNIAAGLAVSAPYLIAALPIAAIAAGIFAKYQKDQKPRYGAYAATTHGGTGQFEDGVGVAGGFGLTFGMNDKGSANIDAEEARAVFEGFAKMSEALEQFYGAAVAAEVEATLKQISNEHYAKTGILNYAMDMNQAFDVAFTQIIDAAAATGDSVAVVMKAVVGDLSGTAENMAKQIETAMQTTTAVIAVAKSLAGTEAGKLLELGDDLTANALRLVDYARALQWAGETTAAALERMGLYLTALDTALQVTGNQTPITGMALVDLAHNLAYAADEAKIGVKGLMELQAFYAKEFLGSLAAFAQQASAARKQIDTAFADLADSVTIPGTRDELTALVQGLDLTTSAGRALYVELMKLAPAFDLLFDAQEQFTNWIDPIDPATKALSELSAVFAKWGLSLPPHKQALLDLYRSGQLSTEQMAILGSHLDDLKLLFPDLVAEIDSVGAAIVDLTDLHIRLAHALGNDGMAGWLERQQELASVGDDASRAMLLMIYAAEDLAKQAGEEGRTPNFNTGLLTALGREMGKGYANFDANRDQATTAAELAVALGPLVGGEELTRLMTSLDTNSDGQLSVLEHLPLMIAANLAPLFAQFDANSDGGLSLAELRTALNGVVDETQLLAIYNLLDINGDGLVDKLEAVRLSLYTSLRDIVSAVDTTGDRQLSGDELRAAFKNNTDPEAMARRTQELLDQNADGLLDAIEALPLSLAGSLADQFPVIDTTGDQQLSLAELGAAYGDLASADQLAALLRLVDLNADGQISVQEAGNLKLDLLALKADKLSDVVQAINNQREATTTGLAAVEDAVTSGLGHLASGLGITGGTRQAATDLPPNLIQEEAGNEADLRAALRDLHAELQALRLSQERTETTRQSSSVALQTAAASLGAAVATIPARIEIVTPALAGEAGY